MIALHDTRDPALAVEGLAAAYPRCLAVREPLLLGDDEMAWEIDSFADYSLLTSGARRLRLATGCYRK